MSIILHDLAFQDDVRPSPYCWRVRLALEHKGLAYTTKPTAFTGIKQIAGGFKTVPVIEDTKYKPARVVHDSWTIANYLEDTYPDHPSLFGEPTSPGQSMGRSYALTLQNWLAASVLLPALKVVLLDIFQRVLPEDRAHFRETREKRFGMSLEAFASGAPEDKAAVVRASLEPLRGVLKEQPFLSGEEPYYPDYVVAGTLFWLRAVSPTALLLAGDPLTPWFERLLVRYDRIASESTRVWAGP